MIDVTYFTFYILYILHTYIQSSCVISSTLLVRSCNAARHRFYLPDFYSADVTQVYVGDGALLVPDDQGYTGVKELYK